LPAVARRVALATYDGAPDLAPDDQHLADALERIGIGAATAVWSDRSVDWRAFDAVVIRSCWDYHRRHGEFMAWLDALDASRRPAWNPTAMVRWNSNKRYLIDLAARGVATVPTRIVERGSPVPVPEVAHAEGWTRFVVKPAVSASAYETHALDLPLGAEDLAAVERVVAHGDALVQPFLDEVTTDGELSLIFFDGVFSHAAIKRSRRGDFRVQTEHGGTVEPIEVAPAVVSQARRSLDALDELPLYARVDGIGAAESFRLMELELIEPNVFLAADDRSADRFAAAIARRLA
jgi:glutathione synthase/RimK-type ligase-like ATP-grasp enzyme